MLSLKKCLKTMREHKVYHLSKKDKCYKKSVKLKKKLGFRYEEIWNLDNTIAIYVLPRLVYFRDIHCGYPQKFQSKEEYDKTLNDIIDGFYLKVTKDAIFWNDDEKEMWKKSKQLFAEYFDSLWD